MRKGAGEDATLPPLPLLQDKEHSSAKEPVQEPPPPLLPSASSPLDLRIPVEEVLVGVPVVHRAPAYRWVMLTLFFLSNLSNCMIWMGAAATQAMTRDYFGVTDPMINYATIIFPAGYIWAGPVATWLVETKGFDFSFRLGALLNGVGGVVRSLAVLLGTPMFLFIYIGNVIASSATPVLLGCPTMLAGSWFSEKERTLATSIMSIADPLGMASSFALSLITSEPDDIYRYNLILGVLSACCAVLVLLLSRKSPPPPSSTAHVQEDNIDTKKVMLACKHIFSIPAFLVVVIVYGCCQGAFFSWVTVLKEVMEGLKYSNNQINACGICMLVASIPGNLIAGVVIDKFRSYKASLNISLIVSTSALICLSLMIWQGWHSFPFFMLCCVILGLFFASVAPVVLELGVEISYPISESISGGILQYASQVFETGFTFGASALLETDDMTLNRAVYMFAGIFSGGLLLFFFFFQPPFYRPGRYNRVVREKTPQTPCTGSLLSEVPYSDLDIEGASSFRHSDDLTENCVEEDGSVHDSATTSWMENATFAWDGTEAEDRAKAIVREELPLLLSINSSENVYGSLDPEDT